MMISTGDAGALRGGDTYLTTDAPSASGAAAVLSASSDLLLNINALASTP
jgi:hypothetical protein